MVGLRDAALFGSREHLMGLRTKYTHRDRSLTSLGAENSKTTHGHGSLLPLSKISAI